MTPYIEEDYLLVCDFEGQCNAETVGEAYGVDTFQFSAKRMQFQIRHRGIGFKVSKKRRKPSFQVGIFPDKLHARQGKRQDNGDTSLERAALWMASKRLKKLPSALKTLANRPIIHHDFRLKCNFFNSLSCSPRINRDTLNLFFLLLFLQRC